MSTKILVTLIFSTILMIGSTADKAQDREECAEQLAGLATCLPYVQGQAKSPTPDCCSGLKQVLKANKKCLCVIIRDRDDPDLGLQINASLALGLPSVCHSPADVTKCPALLHLDPKSPEAQVFYQLAKGSNSTGPSPGPTGLAPTPADGNSEGTYDGRTNSIQGKSEGQSSRKIWLGLEIVAQSLIISYIICI